MRDVVRAAEPARCGSCSTRLSVSLAPATALETALAMAEGRTEMLAEIQACIYALRAYPGVDMIHVTCRTPPCLDESRQRISRSWYVSYGIVVGRQDLGAWHIQLP